MILVSYDISSDKLRNRFSKYLEKYGHRIQYSVFEIENSERILNNVMADIENKFKKRFQQSDSVYIFHLSSHCKIVRYGNAVNEEKAFVVLE